ncbi:hypothetical protein F5Y05DRAFT_328113 [Hypoxylon sp. FL0543]|nr:hypothetical protein F5Y05DRAFT_328113 [Hypoxylon sp. FL0543]
MGVHVSDQVVCMYTEEAGGLQLHSQSQNPVPCICCFMIYVFPVVAWLFCRNRSGGRVGGTLAVPSRRALMHQTLEIPDICHMPPCPSF